MERGIHSFQRWRCGSLSSRRSSITMCRYCWVRGAIQPTEGAKESSMNISFQFASQSKMLLRKENLGHAGRGDLLLNLYVLEPKKNDIIGFKVPSHGLFL